MTILLSVIPGTIPFIPEHYQGHPMQREGSSSLDRDVSLH